jgi:Tol biopolymer transport system component
MKRLVGAETDQHFDALRFMSSSGTWSPDGEQFAFIVFKDGDNAIAILDIKTRKVTRTFKLKDVDEIAHIAWSPDGKKLAISGTSGAISDLYTYDLETSALRRLTNDRYAELQPSWSPDGKWIVFATDRGYPTNLDSLKFSP